MIKEIFEKVTGFLKVLGGKASRNTGEAKGGERTVQERNVHDMSHRIPEETL